MRKPRVQRLLAGILCAAMIIQNLTVTSLAGEPDPAAVQELREETEQEEESAASEENSSADEDATEEKTEKTERDFVEISEREEVSAEEESEESEETDEPEIFDGEIGEAAVSDEDDLIATYSGETVSLLTVKMDAAYQQTEARTMLDLVNEFRTDGDAWYWDETDTQKVSVSGLGKLQWDYNLEEVAMERAAEISLLYKHTRPDGTRCFSAFDNGSGYTYYAMGENISYGWGSSLDSALEAFELWKEDDENYAGQGHRRNMLDEDFNAIGIAQVVYMNKHFWVMELGYSSKPCTKETEAEDETRTLDIQIAASQTQSVTATNPEVEVPYGDSTEMPVISAKVMLDFAHNVQIYADWKSDDSSIADIQNGMVQGKKAGNITFRTTIFPDCTNEQEVTASVTVTPLELTEENVTLAKDSYAYTGADIEPSVTVTWEDTRLKKGTDYTVTYKNNRASGTASIIVEGTGNYGGTVTKYFTISCDHQYDEGVVVTEPDCTHEGVRKYTCKICSEEKTESIKALGHTAALAPMVLPTCTRAGKTQGKYCYTCGVVLKEQEVIPALGHNYVDGVCTKCKAKKPVLTAEDFTVAIPESFVYDGKAKPVTVKLAEKITDAGTITVSYYQDGEKLSGEPVNAGTYEVHISVDESATYYKSEDLHLTQWEYTIKKAKVTVKADDVTVKRGETLPETYTYEVTGLIGDDKLEFEPQVACDVADTSKAGSYEIRPSGETEVDNYTIIYKTGTLVVEEETPIAQGTIDETYGKITWVIDADGVLTVEGWGDFTEYKASDDNYKRSPWYENRDKIKSARIKVTGMRNAASLFYDCVNMTSVDLLEFDTSQVTNMSNMFEACESLKELDLSSLNTSNVTRMSEMFYECKGLTTLDLTNFDTSSVKSMISMFAGCTSLEKVDVSSFDTSNVTDMQYMFSECENLKSLDVSNFRTGKLDLAVGMFWHCSSLIGLDLSEFDFQKIFRAGVLVTGDKNLTYLRTPKNFPEKPNQDLELPGDESDVWYDLKGNVVTEIPTGLAESVTLYKNNRSVLKQPVGLVAEKEKTTYEWGETLTLDDLKVSIRYMDESTARTEVYSTDADSIDMSKLGEKTIHIVSQGMAADVKITVTARHLDETKIIFNTLPEYAYDGTEKTPDLKVYYDGQELEQNVDYTVAYENNKNAGQGIVRITGEDRYEGELKTEFTIKKAVLTVTAPDLTVAQGTRFTANGSKCTIEGLYGKDKLLKNPTYTCTIDTKTVGIYPGVIVPGEADAGNNYDIAYVNGTLTVTERQTQDLAVKEIVQLEYTGSVLKPVLTVYDTDTEAILKSGKDYKIKYYNNVNADQVNAEGGISDNAEENDQTGFDPELPYAVITGTGNYRGNLYVNFHILPVDLDKVTLKYNDQLLINEKKAQKVISSMKYKKAMKEGVDYIVEGNMIPAGASGTFLLKIEGIGNYTGIIEHSIYVADKTKLLKNASIIVDNASKKQIYKGGENTLVFSVRMGKTDLEEGDYIVSYQNNDAIGTATMTLTGTGEYLGTKSVNFQLTGTKLTAKNLQVFVDNENGETVDISRYTVEYSGKPIEPENLKVVLQDGSENGKVLTEGTDYALSYKKHKDAGKATLTVNAAKGSVYEGSASRTFQITPVSLNKTEKTLERAVDYEKSGAKPTPILTYQGEILKEGTDYTVKYFNNQIVGDETKLPTVVVTGKGNYTGTWTETFTILKKSLKDGLADGSIMVEVKPLAFTNSENDAQTYHPAVKVYDGKKALAVGKDYTITYINNTNRKLDVDLSNAEVLIEAVPGGNYEEEITVPMSVYAEKISASNIYTVIEGTGYTGEQVQPDVQVYYGTAQAMKNVKILQTTDEAELKALGFEKLTEGEDYTVSYGANTTAGKNKGSIQITGNGWYGGSASVKFTIDSKQL